MNKAKIYLCVCLCILASLTALTKGESAKEEDCGPTQEELTPPPTPEGYVYLGYVVVVGFNVTDYTGPLERPNSAADSV